MATSPIRSLQQAETFSSNNPLDILASFKSIDPKINFSLKEVKLTKRSFLYQEGEVANSIYLVKEGRIKLKSFSSEGKEIISAILHEGDLLGELVFCGRHLRIDFAQAIEDSVLYEIPLNVVEELIQTNGKFARFIMQYMGKRLIHTNRRLESLVFKRSEIRIIEFVKDLAKQKGIPIGFETLVMGFYTHKEIANVTNTSRQNVTTVLNRLRNQNIIHFDRRRLLVRDLDKLEKLVNNN